MTITERCVIQILKLLVEIAGYIRISNTRGTATEKGLCGEIASSQTLLRELEGPGVTTLLSRLSKEGEKDG